MKGKLEPTTEKHVGTTTTTTDSSIMELVAPLRSLYGAKATVRVMYANHEPLETTYDLSQLKIHESKWLILNLNPLNSLVSTTTTTLGDDDIPPTMRIKLTLNGPYRPEIKALINMAVAWFGIMDGLEENTKKFLSAATPQNLWSSTTNGGQLLALPAIPVVAGIVVVAPVVGGLTMLFLPFLLPVVLLLIGIVVAGILTCSGLYFSTKVGRDHLGLLLSPMM